MSSVKEKFDAMLNDAIRSQDAVTRNLLRTVLGDVQTASLRNGEPITDALFVKTIKSFIEANTSNLKLRENPRLEKENEILNSLLPALMSEHDVMVAIQSAPSLVLGEIMNHLRANHGGLYDGKRASEMARSWIASQSR